MGSEVRLHTIRSGAIYRANPSVAALKLRNELRRYPVLGLRLG